MKFAHFFLLAALQAASLRDLEDVPTLQNEVLANYERILFKRPPLPKTVTMQLTPGPTGTLSDLRFERVVGGRKAEAKLDGGRLLEERAENSLTVFFEKDEPKQKKKKNLKELGKAFFKTGKQIAI